MADILLIIDDDTETLRLISLMLQRQGYQTMTATNGFEGLSLAQKNLPDLIILDIMMPDIDGYTVAKKLKENPDTDSIPILIFTAKSQMDDMLAGFEAGADDYLVKPIHPVELVEHVKNLLGGERPKDVDFTSSSDKCMTIGVLGAKGGQGTSTVTLNLGISINQLEKAAVICAEMTPGNGIWAQQLGLKQDGALENLLNQQSHQISADGIKKNLSSFSSGVQLLTSRASFSSKTLYDNTSATIEIIEQLKTLGLYVILDLGIPDNNNIERLINQCDQWILVTDAKPGSLLKSRILLDYFKNKLTHKLPTLSVVVNHLTSQEYSASKHQILETIADIPVTTIPYAPELGFQSVIQRQPIISIDPNHSLVEAYNQLARKIVVLKENG